MQDRTTQDGLSLDEESPVGRGGGAPSGGSGSVPAERAHAGRSGASVNAWEAIRRFGSIPGVAPLSFGVVAFALAAIGQHILTPGDWPNPTASVKAATGWYAAGAWVLIVGWWGTYRNYSMIRVPVALKGRFRLTPLPWASDIRLVLLAGAVLWNVLSLLTLRNDWTSWRGVVLWIASLVFLVAAFWREPPEEAQGETSATSHGWRFSISVETGILIAIMVVAFILRIWRLGDLTPGMHGDEGEAGSDALGIMNGQAAPLFARGWFNQPNMYYWTIVACMKVFGTNLVGLRSFVVLCGLVTVLFTYLLAREMFGQRAAIIAGAFMSFQSADLLFSRQEFSNGTTPALFVMAFYFAMRGLRTRRHVYFVWSGFASGFSLYYYAGGRLTGPVLLAFFGYLAVIHRRFFRAYWSHVLAYVAALAGMSMPFLGYFVAYPITGLQYPNDRFIWLHYAELAAKYGSGDWKFIVWRQFQATVSIITQGSDVSAMGALNFPIARPIEAVLVVLGLVWAATRWRDTRFFLLSIWFWTVIIAGGVITIEAPNLPRIMAMLPVMAILIAAMLDHFSDLLTTVVEHLPSRPAWLQRRWAMSAAVVSLVVLVAGAQNWYIYFDYYLNTHQNPVVTGQAEYVQDEGLQYRYYGLGAPIVYWTHGDNRFINASADGIDAGDVSTYLPLIDNGVDGQKPANFLLWSPAYDYRNVLRTYYPEGRVKTVQLGDPQHLTDPLIGFIVPRPVINAHRVLRARYVDASLHVIVRREPALGSSSALTPPSQLHYPVRASWDGDLVAPQYDVFRFRLDAAGGAVLSIDGVTILKARHGPVSRTVVLARGAHRVHLDGSLASAEGQIGVQWAAVNGPFGPVSRQFLWDGHAGSGWLGKVQTDQSVAPAVPGALPLIHPDWREDGFIGVRNGAQAYGAGPLFGQWSSELSAHSEGAYGFQFTLTGTIDFRIDGRLVLHQTVPGSAPQAVNVTALLTPGRHRFNIQIHWPGPVDFLEVRWQPPGKQIQIMQSPDLRPAKPGVLLRSTLPGSVPAKGPA